MSEKIIISENLPIFDNIVKGYSLFYVFIIILVCIIIYQLIKK